MSTAPTTVSSIDFLTEHVAAATNMELPFTEELRELISKYPADLIEQLVGTAIKEELAYVYSLLISQHEHSDLIREALCFMPYLPDMPEFRAVVFLKSLHHYPQLPTITDYSADETTRKQCAAIAIVINAVYYRLRNMGYNHLLIKRQMSATGDAIEMLDGNGLVEMLMQQPDDAARIADIVVDRITGHAELIREILNHETPALVDGVL